MKTLSCQVVFSKEGETDLQWSRPESHVSHLLFQQVANDISYVTSTIDISIVVATECVTKISTTGIAIKSSKGEVVLIQSTSIAKCLHEPTTITHNIISIIILTETTTAVVASCSGVIAMISGKPFSGITVIRSGDASVVVSYIVASSAAAAVTGIVATFDDDVRHHVLHHYPLEGIDGFSRHVFDVLKDGTEQAVGGDHPTRQYVHASETAQGVHGSTGTDLPAGGGSVRVGQVQDGSGVTAVHDARHGDSRSHRPHEVVEEGKVTDLSRPGVVDGVDRLVVLLPNDCGGVGGGVGSAVRHRPRLETIPIQGIQQAAVTAVVEVDGISRNALGDQLPEGTDAVQTQNQVIITYDGEVLHNGYCLRLTHNHIMFLARMMAITCLPSTTVSIAHQQQTII
jgi:hypothetical protein